MSLDLLFDTPYCEGTPGGALSAFVPITYPVAVGGHPYMLDESKVDDWSHQSITPLRAYSLANSQSQVDESELNPDALWRRSVSTWHKGAGQQHWDRSDSDPARFRASLGVDVWSRWQLTLLPDVDQVAALGVGGGSLLAADGHLYLLTDSGTLKRTVDLATFTPITGTPAGMVALASDGSGVYAASPSGLHRAPTSGTVAALWQTGSFDNVAYVKSRVMAASGPSLYNIITPSASVAATALFTHANTDWAWDAFGDGDVAIYAAGHAGDYSAIYRMVINDDGADLAAPIVAATMPRGETVTALLGYLDFVVIGTSRGVRLATVDSSGDLILGAVIETGQPVRALTPNGQYVWFGWSDYDAQHTGLGRMDLTVINDTTPAYATDLMAVTSGEVMAAAILDDRLCFTVSGASLYAASDSLVASGTLDTGAICYDLADSKVATRVILSHRAPYNGGVEVLLAVNGGEFVSLGVRRDGIPDDPFDAGQRRGDTFELELKLTRSTAVAGPTLLRTTLLSQPVAASGAFHVLPLMIVANERANKNRARDTRAEYDYLTGLHRSKQLVPLQEGNAVFLATLDEYDFRPEKPTEDHDWFNGVFVAKFKVIDP